MQKWLVFGLVCGHARAPALPLIFMIAPVSVAASVCAHNFLFCYCFKRFRMNISSTIRLPIEFIIV